MKKEIAIRLTSRYLIPFTYDNCKIKYDEVEQETGTWKVAEKNNREKDIYDYISDSFIKKDQCESQDKNNAIACVYKYQNLKQNFKLLYKKKETSFNFYIREVQMILFQNGIGLLWYAPEMRGGRSGTCEFESIEDAAEFVCEFKELARREENNCVYKQDLYDYREGMRIQESDILPGRKKYQKTIKFSMGVWINEILSTLNCKLSYYPYRLYGKDKKRIPDKAILFHHGILYENKIEWENYAFYLTRGYRKNYGISKEDKIKIFYPFENVCCYAAGEGCGYYAFSEKNNSAFLQDSNKIIDDYFMIYVLALYQFYTLLSFSEAIEKRLPIKAENYLDYSPILMDELNTITVKLNIFLARNTYSVVSYIQHHNDFYKYIIKQLRIEENISRLSIGIDSLGKLEKTLEKEKEDRKNSFLEKGLSIVSALALISVWNGIDDFSKMIKNTKCLWNKNNISGSVCNIVVLIFTVITFIFLGTFIFQTIKQKVQYRMVRKKNG